MSRFIHHIKNTTLILFILLILSGSSLQPENPFESVRQFSRPIEFDYGNWTLQAVIDKFQQAGLKVTTYFPEKEQTGFVLNFIDLNIRINQLKAQVEIIYADPNIADPEESTKSINEQLGLLLEEKEQNSLVFETILQHQVSNVLENNNLTSLGQPVPPLLFHISPLPMALIISPRNEIKQEANISLLTELSVEEMQNLETEIDESLDVSSLIVPIGGVGVYPTMVKDTTNLPWLIEVIAHEWTHNYLTLRPLGIRYDLSPELRTINETTANIAGKEISEAVLRKYYPELLPEPIVEPLQEEEPTVEDITVESENEVFDFRAEMHETRINVDQLLAEGLISEAEEYMEERRIIFWENGYLIRKINQAYFAFHGAYADVPGGAAGEDPVGPAVVALREKSKSLEDFLNTIADVTSFEELQTLLQTP